MPNPALPERPGVLPNLRIAAAADAADLAAIRAACFRSPWKASEFSDMLARPDIFCLIIPGTAFVLTQKIPPEAEIITIAVQPEFRRQGIAERMMREVCAQLIAAGIDTLYLEVNEKKANAQKLYAKLGFRVTGRRAGYYTDSTGNKADAILMQRQLPL